MIQASVSGFEDGLISWMPTPEGLTLLVTDAANIDLYIRLKIPRAMLAKAVALSRQAEKRQADARATGGANLTVSVLFKPEEQ